MRASGSNRICKDIFAFAFGGVYLSQQVQELLMSNLHYTPIANLLQIERNIYTLPPHFES